MLLYLHLRLFCLVIVPLGPPLMSRSSIRTIILVKLVNNDGWTLSVCLIRFSRTDPSSAVQEVRPPRQTPHSWPCPVDKVRDGRGGQYGYSQDRHLSCTMSPRRLFDSDDENDEERWDERNLRIKGDLIYCRANLLFKSSYDEMEKCRRSSIMIQGKL